jgi:hypothetical protein
VSTPWGSSVARLQTALGIHKRITVMFVVIICCQHQRWRYVGNRNKNYHLLIWEWQPLWSSGQSSWLQNGDLLYFQWGKNWIYVCYVEESRPPLWSSGHGYRTEMYCLSCEVRTEESRPFQWSSDQSFWLQNGDILCFLWSTNWIYICYVK